MEELKKELEKAAKEENGFEKFKKLYEKFDSKLNELLMEILDEKPSEQVGLKDIWEKIKKKFSSESEK